MQERRLELARDQEELRETLKTVKEEIEDLDEKLLRVNLKIS